MLEHPHFTAELWRFLAELSENNERPWFEANKKRYEAHVREPARAFVRAMAPRLAELAPHLIADDAKVGGSLMRIYRDTRFGKDKTPYKTNVGIQFRHSAGKDVHAPGLYVHFDLDEIFLGVGVWQPPNEALAVIRGKIVAEPDRWGAIVGGPAFQQGFEQHGESLKRPPPGVPKDHPHLEDLKRKSFIAVTKLPDDLAESPSLCDDIAARLASVIEYPRFICAAMGLAF